jgi:hypothetical protein
MKGETESNAVYNVRQKTKCALTGERFAFTYCEKKTFNFSVIMRVAYHHEQDIFTFMKCYNNDSNYR